MLTPFFRKRFTTDIHTEQITSTKLASRLNGSENGQIALAINKYRKYLNPFLPRFDAHGGI